MNYISITKSEVANGEGVRVALWCSGCTHRCKGCQNPYSWDCNIGKKFTDDTMNILLRELSKDYIHGLTLTGGDPLFPESRDTVLEIVKKVKEVYPNKDIWMWTGYLYEEVKDLEIMKYIDVLVDGPYIESQRDITLAWRGSSNQRIIVLNNNNNSENE